MDSNYIRKQDGYRSIIINRSDSIQMRCQTKDPRLLLEQVSCVNLLRLTVSRVEDHRLKSLLSAVKGLYDLKQPLLDLRSWLEFLRKYDSNNEKDGDQSFCPEFHKTFCT
jgi:hypothetical protein